MSGNPSAAHSMQPPSRQSLSLRASVLLKLERFFPPLLAPRHQGEHARYEMRKAASSYGRLVEELGGLQDKRVLDFGCGWGGETAWLAERAASAVGCDINPSSIQDADQFKADLGQSNLSFVLIKGERLPFDDNSFDAVFSTNVFEHVMCPAQVLREIRRVLRPNGSFMSAFGPLFHSALGYHLCWATQVPYAHFLFGLDPILEVRNLKAIPYHPASWEETGLNKITFAQFRAAVEKAGLISQRLKRLPMRRMHFLASLPVLGNFFTFGIDCRLVKPAA